MIECQNIDMRRDGPRGRNRKKEEGKTEEEMPGGSDSSRENLSVIDWKKASRGAGVQCRQIVKKSCADKDNEMYLTYRAENESPQLATEVQYHIFTKNWA
jgi:hypothetical protein